MKLVSETHEKKKREARSFACDCNSSSSANLTAVSAQVVAIWQSAKETGLGRPRETGIAGDDGLKLTKSALNSERSRSRSRSRSPSP